MQRAVLIVEDEQTSATILQKQLHRLQCEVLHCDTGEAAIAHCQNRPFFMIFMDLYMPNMNGIQASDQIRQIPGHHATPIIAMSASNITDEEKGMMRDTGINQFFVKPFSLDILGKLFQMYGGTQPS